MRMSLIIQWFPISSYRSSLPDKKEKIRSGKGSPGFTLLEILLAIFIFGIMITTLFGSFNQILGNAGIIEENIVFNEMAKVCLDRMILDLQGIYITPAIQYTQPEMHSDPDRHRILGEESSRQNSDFPSLRFTSSAHVSFGRNQTRGMAEIVYYVTGTDENMMVLKRADRLGFEKPLEEDRNDPVLCEKLKALSFTYYDKEGEEHTAWDSESSQLDYETPFSIAIHLELGDENGSYHYQTRVQLPVHRVQQGQASS